MTPPLHPRTCQAPPPFSPEFGGLNPSCFVSGVDLELWAHEHSYERLWPIYNYQVRETPPGGLRPMELVVSVDPSVRSLGAWLV